MVLAENKDWKVKADTERYRSDSFRLSREEMVCSVR